MFDSTNIYLYIIFCLFLIIVNNIFQTLFVLLYGLCFYGASVVDWLGSGSGSVPIPLSSSPGVSRVSSFPVWCKRRICPRRHISRPSSPRRPGTRCPCSWLRRARRCPPCRRPSPPAGIRHRTCCRWWRARWSWCSSSDRPPAAAPSSGSERSAAGSPWLPIQTPDPAPRASADERPDRRPADTRGRRTAPESRDGTDRAGRCRCRRCSRGSEGGGRSSAPRSSAHLCQDASYHSHLQERYNINANKWHFDANFMMLVYQGCYCYLKLKLVLSND